MPAPALRPSTPPHRLLTGVTALALLALAGGCNDKPSGELPTWTPADHDNQESPGAGQTDTQAPRPRMPELAEHGIDDVVLATWKQNCTTCHGLIGRGDGPQSAMFRPPDLTSSAFQERAIDSEIVYTIEKGRGRMPAFGHLPKDTIQGLLRLVRMLGAPKPTDSAAAPAAPAGSQPPPGHPPLPAGHPPTGPASAGQPPSARPPSAHPQSAPALPPGHP